MGKMGLPKDYDEDKKSKTMEEETPVDEDMGGYEMQGGGQAADGYDEASVGENSVEAAIDEVELEEDDFKLNESVKRMQKLANLKG